MISKETADYFNALARMAPAQRHARMVREVFGRILPGGFEAEVEVVREVALAGDPLSLPAMNGGASRGKSR